MTTSLSTDELEEIRSRYGNVCEKILEAINVIGLGFTREDVNILREVHDLPDWGNMSYRDEEIVRGARDLADRIEALLPPE